jgi:hypothetical protein
MVGQSPIARNLNVRVAYPRLDDLDQRLSCSRFRHRVVDQGEATISSKLRSPHLSVALLLESGLQSSTLTSNAPITLHHTSGGRKEE